MSEISGGLEPGARATANSLTDEMIGLIFSYLDNSADRNAVSEVCRQWKQVDSDTRKEVRVANCYSVRPEALSNRFPFLVSLKIRGKPRAEDFGLLPAYWGGYAELWVEEVARAYRNKIEYLYLRRMDVKDSDLKVLSESCSESLRSLRLRKCFGFSTAGLACITLRCRSLKVLYLEESNVFESDKGGAWLRQLAESNSKLEELNIFDLDGKFQVHLKDLELLVDNCKLLKALKLCPEINFQDMAPFLRRATSLLELGTGHYATFGDDPAGRPAVEYPRTIISLSGLFDLADRFLPLPSAVLVNLKSLDLQYCGLTQAGVTTIIRHCSNLEVFKVTNDILGDAGLIALAETCMELKKLVVQDGRDPYEGSGYLTPRGILSLVQACVKLEHLVLYVSDLNNATLAAVGDQCKEMKDCRFVLLDNRESLPDLPLDEGVKSLLQGCQNLRRFALFVRRGALTDTGMEYIGKYGDKLRWILLGRAGESDAGMCKMLNGCKSLEKLEIRDCPVTESGLGGAVRCCRSTRLKFIWAQGDLATDQQGKLLVQSLGRPWIVEYCTAAPPAGNYVLAYCSLAPPRTDGSDEIVVLSPQEYSDWYEPIQENGGGESGGDECGGR